MIVGDIYPPIADYISVSVSFSVSVPFLVSVSAWVSGSISGSVFRLYLDYFSVDFESDFGFGFCCGFGFDLRVDFQRRKHACSVLHVKSITVVDMYGRHSVVPNFSRVAGVWAFGGHAGLLVDFQRLLFAIEVPNKWDGRISGSKYRMRTWRHRW